VRVLSYNILLGGQRGEPMFDVVREAAPDLLVVNECPRGLLSWRRRCASLADRWSLRWVTGGRPAGSNMLLVSDRVAVMAAGSQLLPHPLFQWRRGIVWAQLSIGGQPVGVVGSHLSLRRQDRVREAEHLVAAASRLSGTVLVAGDFNERPTGPVWQRLHREGFADHGSRSWLTFPSDDPVKRIDAVLVRGPARVVSHGDPGLPTDMLAAASDHRPVLAELEL
jgi:endonuclease/exonuclease/phosphatase family metal-dependent hydrolase